MVDCRFLKSVARDASTKQWRTRLSISTSNHTHKSTYARRVICSPVTFKKPLFLKLSTTQRFFKARKIANNWNRNLAKPSMLHNMDQWSFYIHLHTTGTVIAPSTQKDEIPYTHIPQLFFFLLGALKRQNFTYPENCQNPVSTMTQTQEIKQLPWQIWASYYTGRWVITRSSIFYQELAFYLIIFYYFYAI